MQSACTVAILRGMPKHVQIRDVPDEVHEALRARADELGVSLTELLQRELRRMVGRPNRADLWREIDERDDNVVLDVAAVLRAIDEGRRDR